MDGGIGASGSAVDSAWPSGTRWRTSDKRRSGDGCGSTRQPRSGPAKAALALGGRGFGRDSRLSLLPRKICAHWRSTAKQARNASWRMDCAPSGHRVNCGFRFNRLRGLNQMQSMRSTSQFPARCRPLGCGCGSMPIPPHRLKAKSQPCAIGGPATACSSATPPVHAK